MKYRSVVALAPTSLPDDYGEVFDGMFRYCNERFRTISWSIDDALNLVNSENANEKSSVEIWNGETREPDQLNAIYALAPNYTYMNYPTGRKPFITELQEVLPQVGKWAERDLDNVWLVALHHSVGWDSMASNAANAIRIANYHINHNKWVSAGYHFLIGPDGEIMQLNYLREKSYHIGTLDAPGDENKIAIGICLGGDFRYREPSQEQILSSAALYSWLQNELVSDLVLLPHKRTPGSSTACPGYNIDPWLRRVSGKEDYV